MEEKITLGQILEKHPEWKDHPIGIFCEDGHCDIVGLAGRVCEETACYYKDDMEHTIDYPNDAECVISDYAEDACNKCKYAYKIVKFSPN